jgi:DNA-binding HxlR family transcriptional regulator
MTDSRPAALDWSTENCPVVEAAQLIGDRSTLIVLRELLLGVRRFSDMQEHAGIPKQVLSDRLALLVEHGLVRKAPYRIEGQRERTEYRLTEAGLELYPTILALADWGRRHLLDSPDDSPVDFVHRGCGGEVVLQMACVEHDVVLEPREVVSRPGPGARRRTSRAAGERRAARATG